MAANGTIGLEVLEDLPDVDSVVIAYGGGGLCCGVAAAIKAMKPEVRVYACEAETSAPLAAALAAAMPVRIDYSLSFVDGIGSPIVQPEMFALATRLLDGVFVTTLSETAAAIRLIAERNHAIAEGAGAVSVAAALAGKAGSGKVACVVSGGNIDSGKLVTILQGGMPLAG
jgi:threonine dehydratase